MGFKPSAYLTNKWLDMLRGTAFTAPAAVYVKLHTGDPGSSGTSNASATTTRVAITWAAATGGALAINGTLPKWSALGTAETISYVSLWDASSSGNHLGNYDLTTPRSVLVGDDLTLNTASLSLATVA